MRQLTKVFSLLLLLTLIATNAQKPKVWIISDGSDKEIKNEKTGKPIGDPDDLSAISGYLLMSNLFDTRGIVVASTQNFKHRIVPNQKDWADKYFGKAYAKDLPNLNKNIGGFQPSINFIESCIKETGERFNNKKEYKSLKNYKSIEALFKEVDKSKEIINILCWGQLAEPAIFIKHCMSTNRFDILNKVRFIAHWTNSSFKVGTPENPEHVHNCFNDAEACAFIKLIALNGHVKYYECGAIGETGLGDGSPKGEAYYDQFKVSALGYLFSTSKYVPWKKRVDDSDAATYWALLGDWGVSLNTIASNGTNKPEVEKANQDSFEAYAPLIRKEMLRRAIIASKN